MSDTAVFVLVGFFLFVSGLVVASLAILLPLYFLFRSWENYYCAHLNALATNMNIAFTNLCGALNMKVEHKFMKSFDEDDEDEDSIEEDDNDIPRR